MKDFIKVTVVERDKFDSAEKASKELGYTSVESFKQALKRNRERFPKVFEGVAKYTVVNGPRVATEDEALAMLAELKAPAEEKKEDAPTAPAE
jgi:hypothetical protein